MNEPNRLEEPLRMLMRSLGSPRADEQALLADTWAEVVGTDAAAESEPVKVVDGVLTVQCLEPAWAARLRWTESAIVAAVEQRFPALEVTRVMVRVGG